MLTCISGTNRPGSNTRRVANELSRIYSGLGRDLRLLDLTELPPEIYLPTAYAQKPPAFERFARAVSSSSGLIVVTPEYNGSFPGVLKVLLDHLPFPQSFEWKPVCFIGLSAGMWGGLRPVEQLQDIFGYRNAHLYPERVFIPRCGAAFDPEGRICDGELLTRLEQQARGFLQFVTNLTSSTSEAI